MTRPDVFVTGFSSIGAGGPAAGLPGPALEAHAEVITRWATPSPRRAILVPPFRPTDVVPGLRTRRLDRLSVWALVGTALALQDAGIEQSMIDADRTAVVFGTAFGCLELSEQFLAGLQFSSAHADPIVFPETLANQPTSHVARQFVIRGPNVTVCAKLASSEAALIEAASLLRANEADRAVVLAGDLITRSLFEWYEAAGLLSPVCGAAADRSSDGNGGVYVPGEGLVACVIETREVVERRQARLYGRYCRAWVGPSRDAAGRTGGTDLAALLSRAAPDIDPDEVQVMANPRAGHSEAAGGAFGGCGLLHLGYALGRLVESDRRYVMVAGTVDCDQHSAVLIGKSLP